MKPWKALSTFTFLIFTQAGFGTSMSIIGPCNETSVFSEARVVNEPLSVGQFTVSLLTEYQIEFVGSEEGMISIFDSPIGSEAIEIVSENEMYAYGWCYSVNGFEPNVYPHEVFINPEGDDQIIWWFGFAHYLNGQWLSMCEPSYERKPDFLCANH